MSWLISKTLMNSLCSQELAVESLVDTCLDGEQSVPLNGNNIPQAYCAPDKMTGFSRLSRFGMTYKPLTETRGEELLTLYRAAFHARTSQLLEKAQELTESDQVCGDKWRGSFTKYSPDSCSWKTHQCSLLGDLDEFSETWPQWGLMRDGECWEQRTLAQTIRGTESGLWATSPPPPKMAYASHIRCNRGGESWPSQKWEHKQLERLLEQVAQTGIPAGKHNRIHDGVAARMDRLKAIGNGQVPLCAATAWRILSESL